MLLIWTYENIQFISSQCSVQVSLCRSVVSILLLSWSERYTSVTNDNYFILPIHLYGNSMAKIVDIGRAVIDWSFGVSIYR